MARGYNEEIDVNMVPGGPLSVWHSSQYDELRKLRVNLYNGKSLQWLGNNVTVSLSVRKPDNTVIETSDPDVISIQTEQPYGETVWKYIEINTTEQMTACVGKSICEIVVYETDGGSTSKVGSANFILEVERDPLAGGVESGSVIEDLQAQVDAAVEETMNNMSLDDIGDVETFPELNGNSIRYDNTTQKWQSVTDIYAHNYSVSPSVGSFVATFDFHEDAINKDKKIFVYRDSYASNPPTSVSLSESLGGARLDVTVNFEPESSNSNWRVEVEICRTSGT